MIRCGLLFSFENTIFMKRLYILLFLAILAIVPAVAQSRHGNHRDDKRKELREYKMKYLAQEMELSEDDQKHFFEVYNQLSDERAAVKKQIRGLDRKVRDKTATEADYDALNKAKEKFAEIDKKYDAKFATFLTGKQIFKMKEAEAAFMKKMREMRAKGRKK